MDKNEMKILIKAPRLLAISEIEKIKKEVNAFIHGETETLVVSENCSIAVFNKSNELIFRM